MKGRQSVMLREANLLMCKALLMGVVTVLSVNFLACPEDLPPENYTSTALWVLKRRIHAFATQNDRLPSAVSDLPEIEGFMNSSKDAWGHEIHMHVNSTCVTLVSYGKDNKPGGEGADRDVTGIFDTKDAAGNWHDQDCGLWVLQPLCEGR